jgi:hypothetical protein
MAPSGPTRCTNAVKSSVSGAAPCQRKGSVIVSAPRNASGKLPAPVSSIPLRQRAAMGVDGAAGGAPTQNQATGIGSANNAPDSGL